MSAPRQPGRHRGFPPPGGARARDLDHLCSRLAAAWQDADQASLHLEPFIATLTRRPDDAPRPPREGLLIALLAEMSGVLDDTYRLAECLARCLRRRRGYAGLSLDAASETLASLRRAEGDPLREADELRERLHLWLADACHWLDPVACPRQEARHD